VGIIVHSDLQQ